MTKQKTAVIVLAAGMGTRMKSAIPKVLHAVASRPMVGWALNAAETLSPEHITVVVGPDMDAVTDAVRPHGCVVQKDRFGTAHAVLAARETLTDFDGDALVLYGDTPLVSKETLRAMMDALRTPPHPAVVVLGFSPEDPGMYGRLIVDGDGGLDAIVEAREASPEQLKVSLCNSGVVAVGGGRILDLLDRVDNDNAKGEYYLTDIVELARADGLACGYIECGAEEVSGVNSRVDLAEIEAVVQQRMRRQAMDDGATLTDPASVHFSFDTQLGRDVVVGPNVFFGPGVRVGDNVDIRSFCHFEGATIADGAIIGPFARLRPGAKIADDAHIGNFVEIKNASIEVGAKVNHLSYIGDARVGTKANIGAGTITCNYDGYFKSHTDIGAGAFIGSNTALVAPVTVGDGATVGAGSVIARDVAADSLAVTRGPLMARDQWAKKFRERRSKEKEAAQKAKK